MEIKPHYYSNPAFCQKSEYINGRALSPPRTLSPQSNIRQSPVGAQTIPRILDSSITENHNYPEEEGLQEQEFYEEVVVDDQGFITDKKVVVVAQNNEGKKYIQVPPVEDRYGSRYGTQKIEDKQGNRYDFLQSEESRRKGARYGSPQQIMHKKETKVARSQSMRYEYIQMQEQDGRLITPKSSPTKTFFHEDIEISPGRVHRYAVIDAEEETELTSKNARYALVPVDHLNNIVPHQKKNRYEYIQEPLRPALEPQRSTVPQSPSRYEYIQTTPQKNVTRYEYTQQSPRVGNPIATQKLHEFLSTPKKSTVVQKQVLLSPQSLRKTTSPPLSPIPKDTFQSRTPSKIKGQVPKAQQKLNYALGSGQLVQDKRHTAIVTPLCSSPIQSVYSETTYSTNKSESWMNLSVKKEPVQVTLAFAAIVMFLCGGITAGLCFYMMSFMGKPYFLEFGVVAGFAYLILGLLGLRTRNLYWLPNRNYISGYLLLTVFSLLTCACLLVIRVMQPRTGTPLADMTSGAVCGISVFSLVLAMTGMVSSYCCKYPPPDNRVQHCAEGFSV